uniref:Putative salivary secreted protein n=1 Tax=Ornithodoros parkeri TaxID=140564 RepID=A6NA10_ORNPR|nr:putative salivary secreted protein [Ornithodoros parkeri]
MATFTGAVALCVLLNTALLFSAEAQEPQHGNAQDPSTVPEETNTGPELTMAMRSDDKIAAAVPVGSPDKGN